MLAHLKAKQREQHQDDGGPPPAVQQEPAAGSSPQVASADAGSSIDGEKYDARLTCAALCSLSASCGISAKGVCEEPPSGGEGECIVGKHATATAVAEDTGSTAAMGIHGFLFVDDDEEDDEEPSSKAKSLKGCPKQHQLPMFLSSKSQSICFRVAADVATPCHFFFGKAVTQSRRQNHDFVLTV